MVTIQVKLKCLKPVSTLSRDLVIRRIDTTDNTLSRNNNVMEQCETSLIAEQEGVIFVT